MIFIDSFFSSVIIPLCSTYDIGMTATIDAFRISAFAFTSSLIMTVIPIEESSFASIIVTGLVAFCVLLLYVYANSLKQLEPIQSTPIETIEKDIISYSNRLRVLQKKRKESQRIKEERLKNLIKLETKRDDLYKSLSLQRLHRTPSYVHKQLQRLHETPYYAIKSLVVEHERLKREKNKNSQEQLCQQLQENRKESNPNNSKYEISHFNLDLTSDSDDDKSVVCDKTDDNKFDNISFSDKSKEANDCNSDLDNSNENEEDDSEINDDDIILPNFGIPYDDRFDT